jgi:PAS domain S-box-containing protein
MAPGQKLPPPGASTDGWEPRDALTPSDLGPDRAGTLDVFDAAVGARSPLPELDRLLQVLNDAVAILDTRWEVRAWNPAAARLYGLTSFQAIGMHMRSILPEESYLDPGESELTSRISVVEKGFWRGTVSQRRPDGTEVIVDKTVAEIRNSAGRATAIVVVGRDITEQRSLEGLLTSSETSYRDLFDSAPIGYVSVGIDGRIIRANQKYSDIMGYSPLDLIGRSILDMYADTPSGKQKARGVLQRFIAGLETQGEELQVARADGQIRWVKLTVNPVVRGDGRVVASRSMVEDITDLRATSEALRRSDRRFSTAFRNAPIGMHLTTIEGKMMAVNPALCRVLRYTEDQLLGMQIWDFIDPAFHETVRRARALLTEGRQDSTQFTIRYKRGDGSHSWSSVGIMLPEADTDFVVAMMVDITELVDTQERLSGLVEEKSRFIATVSHELRTPLAGVLGFASELRDRADTFSQTEVAEFARLITEGCATIGNLVDDLLTAARLETGRISLALDEVDLQQEAAVAVAEAKAIVHLGSKAISVEGSPALAYADPHRVRQIVRNLLVNAGRHGGENLAVRTGYLPNESAAFLRVLDDGAGVPSHIQETLFEPYQHGGLDHRNRESVGLGLFISRNLAHLMGGDLTYSRADGWTVFEMTLPVEEQPAEG